MRKPYDDLRFTAAVDLLGRTGAAEFQARFCEEEEPVIWIAAARWGDSWEAAAGLSPVTAVFRLCNQVIDGGTCTHCERPAGFSADPDAMPLPGFICWYQFDPGTKAFAKGCAA